MNSHTLSVLVQNKPGVLMRVAALFSRRAFNIHSLAVGETENPEVSRITIVTDAEQAPLEQIIKQLNKLIEVLKVVEIDSDNGVERQLMLVKVRVGDKSRTAVMQIVQLFRVRVVDVHPESLVVEAVGSEGKLAALLRSLEPYGIAEIVQSGSVAIGRGTHSITDQLKEK